MSRRYGLCFLLILALAALACAGSGPTAKWSFEGRRSAQLYERASPPKPRIPGQASTRHRYAEAVAPMRLTASDGTGLALRRVAVEARIDEPVAVTELHLTFENPHDAQLDGQFELLLPRGAEVSRFALKVGGEWMESEVVERQRAWEVYDDHKATRVDPAIFQRERGRRFTGRVFPIAPRERKQIIVAYTTIHAQADEIFRVPLAGLPRVDELDIDVELVGPGGSQHLRHHLEHQAPSEDFTVELAGPAQLGLRVGNEALLRIVPSMPSMPSMPGMPGTPGIERDEDEGLSILIDTSASTAPTALAMELALGDLLAALAGAGLGELPLEVLAYDQTVHPLFHGTVAGADERVVERLHDRARLGASDLGRALAAVGPSFDRVLCLTDGEITAGASSWPALAEVLDEIHERGVIRLDAVVFDASADVELLERLVRERAFEPGVVFDAQSSSPTKWIEALRSPALGPVEIAVAGATQVWPREFDGLRPGEAVMVHARFKGPAPRSVAVSVAGAVSSTSSVELRVGDEALTGRSIALLRVKALLAEIEAGATRGEVAAAEREIAALAKQHRILTDSVAMLALESERDYQRYGIERSADPTRIVTVSTKPVRQDTATALKMGEEIKQLPVGNDTARDFTAVAEIAPTSSRDAAGISLAGATGARSLDEYEPPRSRRTRRRGTSATVSVRRLRGVGGRAPAAARELADALDDELPGCARHAAALDGWLNDELVVALRFDPSGALIEARTATQSTPREHLLDCVRYRLLALAGPGTREPSEGEPIEIRRYYRLTAAGVAHAPDDWTIPEVLAYTHGGGGQTGAIGWAQFIEEDLAVGLIDEALDVAWTWHEARPHDLLPYVSLGRALAAAGRHDEAVRAYGSLIDVEPARPESRRFAAALLESTGDPAALDLAIDSYRKARALRPDHPTGHHALALALAARGDHHEAMHVLIDALERDYPPGRFGDVLELMRRDLETLSAAAILARPESRAEVLAALVDLMVVPKALACDRLTLTWESEASHLELSLRDADGAIHQHHLGELLMSTPVRTGFGPQSATWDAALDGPLWATVHAYDLGPSRFAMGRVHRLRFDGEGDLQFESRPFVIWPSRAAVDLGEFDPW